MLKSQAVVRVLMTAFVTLFSLGSLAGSVQLSPDEIHLEASKGANVTGISLSGPKGYSFASPDDAWGSYSLSDLGIVDDGLYRFQFTEYEHAGEEDSYDPANGRVDGSRKTVKSFQTHSGHFRVKNGEILVDDSTVEGEE